MTGHERILTFVKLFGGRNRSCTEKCQKISSTGSDADILGIERRLIGRIALVFRSLSADRATRVAFPIAMNARSLRPDA